MPICYTYQDKKYTKDELFEFLVKGGEYERLNKRRVIFQPEVSKYASGVRDAVNKVEERFSIIKERLKLQFVERVTKNKNVHDLYKAVEGLKIKEVQRLSSDQLKDLKEDYNIGGDISAVRDDLVSILQQRSKQNKFISKTKEVEIVAASNVSVTVTDKSRLKRVISSIFGLSSSKSEAVASLYDKVLTKISERKGLTLKEVYKTLGFQASLLETLEDGEVKIVENLLTQKKYGEAVDTLYQLVTARYIYNTNKTSSQLESLLHADKLYKSGTSSTQIWHETGWEYNELTNQWLTEINTDIHFVKTTLKEGTYKLSDYLDFSSLYKNFPDAKNINFTITRGTTSYYDRQTNTINFDLDDLKEASNYLKIISPSLYKKNKKSGKSVTVSPTTVFKGVMLHEIQHYIQHETNQPLGGSPSWFTSVLQIIDDPSELDDASRPLFNQLMFEINRTDADVFNQDKDRLYHGLEGERQARLIEIRELMGEDYKKLVPPSSTMDSLIQNASEGVFMHIFESVQNYAKFRKNIQNNSKFQKNNEEARAAIQAMGKGQNLIHALTDPNITSPLHELAHAYEDVLTNDEIKQLEEWSGYEGGTVDFSEVFAKGFEKFLHDDNAANSIVNGVFEKVAKWFKEVIENAVEYFGSINVLSPEIKDIYQSMVGVQTSLNSIKPKESSINIEDITLQDIADDNEEDGFTTYGIFIGEEKIGLVSGKETANGFESSGIEVYDGYKRKGVARAAYTSLNNREELPIIINKNLSKEGKAWVTQLEKEGLIKDGAFESRNLNSSNKFSNLQVSDNLQELLQDSEIEITEEAILEMVEQGLVDTIKSENGTLYTLPTELKPTFSGFKGQTAEEALSKDKSDANNGNSQVWKDLKEQQKASKEIAEDFVEPLEEVEIEDDSIIDYILTEQEESSLNTLIKEGDEVTYKGEVYQYVGSTKFGATLYNPSKDKRIDAVKLNQIQLGEKEDVENKANSPFENVVSFIQRLLPEIKVEIANKKDITHTSAMAWFETDEEGNAKIVVNPAVKDNLTLPVHEMLHPFVLILKDQNFQSYAALRSELLNEKSEEYAQHKKEIESNKDLYINLLQEDGLFNDELLTDEIMVRILTSELSEFFDEEGNISQEKLLDYENNTNNIVVRFFKELHRVIMEVIFGPRSKVYEDIAKDYTVTINQRTGNLKLITSSSTNKNNNLNVDINLNDIKTGDHFNIWQKRFSMTLNKFLGTKDVHLTMEETDHISHEVNKAYNVRIEHGVFVKSESRSEFLQDINDTSIIYKVEGEEKTHKLTKEVEVRARDIQTNALVTLLLKNNQYVESVDVKDMGNNIELSLPKLPFNTNAQLDITALSPKFRVADMAYLIASQKVKRIELSAHKNVIADQKLFASIADESTISNFRRLRGAMSNLKDFAETRRSTKDDETVQTAMGMLNELKILINEDYSKDEKQMALHAMLEKGFLGLELAKTKMQKVIEDLGMPNLEVFYDSFITKLRDEGYTVVIDKGMNAYFKLDKSAKVITLRPNGHTLIKEHDLKSQIRENKLFSKIENIRLSALKEGRAKYRMGEVDLLVTSEELSAAKQLYATFKEFNGKIIKIYKNDLDEYYDNQAEDFENYETDRGRYIQIFEKSIATGTQLEDLSRQLATEFLLPTFQELQREAMSNLSEKTREKYAITEKDFIKLLESADSDAYLIDMLLEATVNSKDPVTATLAVMISERLYRNKQVLNDKGLHLKTIITPYFKKKGINPNNHEEVEAYIKENFLRQIEIKVPLVIRGTKQYEADGTPKTVLEKKWAFWTKYDQHQVNYDMQKWSETNPPPDSRLLEEDYQSLKEEWLNEKEVHLDFLIDKYTNSEFNELKNDELFDAIYTNYEQANIMYGAEGLKYGIIPQKVKHEKILNRLINRYERTKTRANSYVKAAKEVEKSKTTTILSYTPFKAIMSGLFRMEEDIYGYQSNPDGSIYRPIVTKYITHVKSEDLDFLLTDSILGFVENAQNFGALKSIQHNVENLRTVVTGNSKLGIESRTSKLNPWSRIGGIRNSVKKPHLTRQFTSFVDDVMYGVNRTGGKLSLHTPAKYNEMKKQAYDMEQELQNEDGSLSKTAVNEIFKKTSFYRDVNDDRNLTSDVYFPIGINFDKIANNLSFYTSLTSLAINVVSGLRNSQIGNFMNLSEAYGGRYYTVPDYLKANKIYFGYLPSNFKDYGSNTKNKLNQLIVQFSAIQGEFRDKYDKMITTGSEMQRFATWETLFVVQHGTEHQIQGTAMIAMMLKEKVSVRGADEQISLWDAFEMKEGVVALKDGVVFPSELQDNFIRRLQEMNRQNHGNYSAINKGVAQRHFLGHMALVFKKHLFTTIKARYQPARIDYSRGELVEGYHRTFFRKLIEELNEGSLLNLISKDKKSKGWEEYEIYGFRRASIEMLLGTFVPMLVSAMLLGVDDDDKDKNISHFLKNQKNPTEKAKQYILTLTNSLYTDVGITNPFGIINPFAGWSSDVAKEVASMADNPSAVIYTYTKLAKFFTQLTSDVRFGELETYDKKYLDQYKKGDTKLGYLFKKSIPIYSKIEGLNTPERHLKYQTMMKSTLISKRKKNKRHKK